jgi:hypothetical protein
MYMIIEDIPWLHFVKLSNIAKLSLSEQVQKYRQHLCEVEMIRYSIECGGKSATKTIVQEGFLQQEDLYYILQEDGSRIYVTVEKTI